MFKKRAFFIGLGLQFALTFGALACEGQSGAVIFEDNFADDSGGWDLSPGQADIKSQEMLLTLSSEREVISVQNLTFNPSDGDYCIDFVLPPPLAPDNNAAVGIEFWATGWRDYYSVQVFSNRDIALYRNTSNGWLSIFMIHNSPAVKTGFDSPVVTTGADSPVLKTTPDAVNSIRVVAKAGRIITFVNGTKIKEIRAQLPSGSLRFGAFAQVDKAVPEGATFHIKAFKVTAGP